MKKKTEHIRENNSFNWNSLLQTGFLILAILSAAYTFYGIYINYYVSWKMWHQIMTDSNTDGSTSIFLVGRITTIGNWLQTGGLSFGWLGGYFYFKNKANGSASRVGLIFSAIGTILAIAGIMKVLVQIPISSLLYWEWSAFYIVCNIIIFSELIIPIVILFFCIRQQRT